MDKQSILKHIEKMSFSSDLSLLFSIIEKNLDRIEFTKDYAGLRDFIYLAESDAAESEFPFFSCFDFGENNHYSEEGIYNEVVYDIPSICHELKRFLKHNDRLVYIAIGFKDSILTSEDFLYIHTMLENNVIRNKQEGELKLREFPAWYTAKYPHEILEDDELQKLIEKLRTIETKRTEKLKEKVLHLINEALDRKDKASFYALSKKLQNME